MGTRRGEAMTMDLGMSGTRQDVPGFHPPRSQGGGCCQFAPLVTALAFFHGFWLLAFRSPEGQKAKAEKMKRERKTNPH